MAQLAQRLDLPIAVHLAESVAESQLIASGTGPFAEAWRARGIPLPDDVRHLDRPLAVRTPVRWLDAFGILGPDTLCIHAVQADSSDIALLARREASVVLCPRSNAAHRHGEAPVAELLAAGLRVGIGTDSAAIKPEGELGRGQPHPRSYGTFPRILGHYVREEKVLGLPEAIRKMTSLAASQMKIADRGSLKEGNFADAYGDSECLVEIGCWGPVVQCNITSRGAINHLGGCMNTGGVCIGCTMPGFPDRFAPFYKRPPGSFLSSGASRTVGKVLNISLPAN